MASGGLLTGKVSAWWGFVDYDGAMVRAAGAAAKDSHHGRAGGGGAYGRSGACGLPAAGLGRSPDGPRCSATLTVRAAVETAMPPRLQRSDGPPANQPTPKPTTPKSKPNRLIGIA